MTRGLYDLAAQGTAKKESGRPATAARRIIILQELWTCVDDEGMFLGITKTIFDGRLLL